MASFKRNYLYQVLYEILAIVLPLITAPYIARVMGAENLGIFSYSHSIANLFLMIARLGVVSHGSRSIAVCQKDPEKRNRIFSEIFSIQAIFGLMVTAVYIMYIVLFVQANQFIFLLQTIFVISSVFDIGWFFMGLENFKKTVTRNIVVKIVSLICIFMFVHERDDLGIYTVISTGSMLLGHLTLWVGLRKVVKFVKPTPAGIIEHSKGCLVMFVPTIAGTLYAVLDRILLGSITAEIQVGYYEQAAKLIAVPFGFISSFGVVMLPRMSAMEADGTSGKEGANITYKSLVFMVAVATAISFGMASVSETLIPIYYGAEFLACIPLLMLISVKLPFMAWANVIRTQCLIPKHRDKQYIISLLVGVVVNIIVNLLLISKLKAIGAAIATISAEVFVCIVQSVFARDALSLKKPFFHSLGFVAIGAIMYAIVYILSITLPFNALINLCIEIACGGLIFIGLGGAFYCGVVEKKSPKKVLKSLRKKS